METTNTMQSIFEIISFIASIASLLLAVGAIWLSIVFFKMSNEAAKETTKAASEIQSNVERLEKLFDKLYSDTFSMMKDTVTDMREHIWKKPNEINENDDENTLEKVKETLKNEIISLVDNKIKAIDGNEEKIKELELSINNVIDSKINSNNLPTLKDRLVLMGLISANAPIKLKYLRELWAAKSDNEFPTELLFTYRNKGSITWDGNPDIVSSDSVIFKVKTLKNEDN